MRGMKSNMDKDRKEKLLVNTSRERQREEFIRSQTRPTAGIC
jgi:hypothetical protein